MYLSDDIVTTVDGRKHRVIYQTKDQLLVRTLECKHKKTHKISGSKVVKHEPKTQTQTR